MGLLEFVSSPHDILIRYLTALLRYLNLFVERTKWSIQLVTIKIYFISFFFIVNGKILLMKEKVQETEK